MIAAGVLSVPGLVVYVVAAPFFALLSLPAAFFLVSRKPSTALKEEKTLSQNTAGNEQLSHVIVTGGSSGIGRAVAAFAAEEATALKIGKITVIARNASRLKGTQDELEDIVRKQKAANVKIKTVSVDVTNPEALATAAKTIMEGDNNDTDKTTRCVKTFLFCCAGEAYPEKFVSMTSETFVKQAQVNQFGSIFTVQAFLPYIQAGTITLCSSVCGQVGIYGYSSYAPAKFALRGFAEVLHAELCSKPIHVQVAYPPDTQTPGFDRENLTKPKATKLISEKAGLFQPGQIGRKMLHEAMASNPRFAVYFDLDGWMISNLTAGFAPVTNWMDAVTQLALSSILRWISLFYVMDFHQIIQKCDKEEDEEMKRKNS